MIIKNSQQDIMIDLDRDVARVGIKMSGGADSSLLAYILAMYVSKERPDIQVIPITVVHTKKPYQLLYAKRVIDFIENVFGKIFSDHLTDTCDSTSTYSSTQDNLMVKAYNENIIDVHFFGGNALPPMDVVRSFKDELTVPEREKTSIPHPTKYLTSYRPFINIDKRGIAETYQTLNLIDTLYPITRSCEAYTHDFSQHCGECWWCEERLWGFGKIV
jgi:hypothetical protein